MLSVAENRISKSLAAIGHIRMHNFRNVVIRFQCSRPVAFLQQWCSLQVCVCSIRMLDHYSLPWKHIYSVKLLTAIHCFEVLKINVKRIGINFVSGPSDTTASIQMRKTKADEIWSTLTHDYYVCCSLMHSRYYIHDNLCAYNKIKLNAAVRCSVENKNTMKPAVRCNIHCFKR